MTRDDRASSERTSTRRRLAPLAAKVPEITLMFWVLKLLTTGMGEAMSDFLGQQSVPLAGADRDPRDRRRLPPAVRASAPTGRPYYWFAVMMVAVFGTMAADGIRDGAGLTYTVTTPLFALITAAIFALWYRSEGTLSIHSITTRRRESFYWAAVLATFALGTAAGDLTAFTLHLGFSTSILLFALLIAIPALGWWRGPLNPTVAFWTAYVLTRPLAPRSPTGSPSRRRSAGSDSATGSVSGLALIVFIGLVAYVTATGRGAQPSRSHATPTAEYHLGPSRCRPSSNASHPPRCGQAAGSVSAQPATVARCRARRTAPSTSSSRVMSPHGTCSGQASSPSIPSASMSDRSRRSRISRWKVPARVIAMSASRLDAHAVQAAGRRHGQGVPARAAGARPSGGDPAAASGRRPHAAARSDHRRRRRRRARAEWPGAGSAAGDVGQHDHRRIRRPAQRCAAAAPAPATGLRSRRR